MAGAAVRSGAAAASRRGGIRRGYFPSALEAEGGEFLLYLAALTVRAFDFGFGIENDLLEIFLAALATIFKNWHIPFPSAKL